MTTIIPSIVSQMIPELPLKNLNKGGAMKEMTLEQPKMIFNAPNKEGATEEIVLEPPRTYFNKEETLREVLREEIREEIKEEIKEKLMEEIREENGIPSITPNELKRHLYNLNRSLQEDEDFNKKNIRSKLTKILIL